MAEILEVSEDPSRGLDQIAEVRSKRGEEVRVNMDATIRKIVDLWSDHRRERQEGGMLTEAYYQAFAKVVLENVETS